jgi:purine-cytosine permease-like protein
MSGAGFPFMTSSPATTTVNASVQPEQQHTHIAKYLSQLSLVFGSILSYTTIAAESHCHVQFKRTIFCN